METYRPLRAGLFFYEIVRFLIILGEIKLFSSITGAAQPENFLLAFWSAPNALFPCVTLFLLIDLGAYKPYLPLYIAGKCLGVAVAVGTVCAALGASGDPATAFALLLSGGDMGQPLPFASPAFLFLFLFTIIGDIVSIIDGAVILNRIHKKDTKQSEIESENEKNGDNV
jgi:hypothetical protein